MSIIVNKDPADLIWPDDFINKIICGDCLEVMKKIPDGAVDLVLTDPPYGCGKAEWDAEYPIGFIRKSYRVADIVVVMTGQWALQAAIDEMGATYRGMIIGYNLNGMTFSPLGFGNWIPALIGGDFKKKGPDGFLFTVNKNKPKHPSPKPADFMMKLTGRVSEPNNLILDPFLGSGTTAVAAKQLGRRFIGIEISMDYCKIAEDRLRQGELF